MRRVLTIKGRKAELNFSSTKNREKQNGIGWVIYRFKENRGKQFCVV